MFKPANYPRFTAKVACRDRVRNRRLTVLKLAYLVFVSVLVVSTGCMVGPDFQSAAIPKIGQSYSTEPLPVLETERLGAWWNAFSDPTLNVLLSQAELQNLELEEAYHRVTESRAELCLNKGSLRPDGDVVGDYSYRKRSPNASPFVGSNSEPFNRFTVGLQSSWELDFFGRIKRTVEAADAELGFTTADHDHIRLSLLSDVASSYFRIRWIQQQIEITRESLAIQTVTTTLIEERAAAGLSMELDLVQAKAFQLRTKSTIPNLEQQLAVEFNRLSLLLGETPSQEIKDFVGVGPLPTMPDIEGVGIPANLLRNRPDVIREEKNVAAASARIGIAKADLYPQFHLLGTISVSAKTVSSMFEQSGLLFNVGPSFQWNILHFGRIFSNVEAHEARFDQAVAQYQQTILRAVGEVEDALVQQFGFEQERLVITEAIEFDKKAIELGLQRYQVGKASFQRVLDAEVQLLQDQQRQLDAQAQGLIQTVLIYKSVGGGWEPVERNCLVSSSAVMTPIPALERLDAGGLNRAKVDSNDFTPPAFRSNEKNGSKSKPSTKPSQTPKPIEEPTATRPAQDAVTLRNGGVSRDKQSGSEPMFYDLWSTNE